MCQHQIDRIFNLIFILIKINLDIETIYILMAHYSTEYIFDKLDLKKISN